jgi:octaprenyl-diphosphate synthase
MKSDESFVIENLIAPISAELSLVEKGLLAEADSGLDFIRSMNKYVHNSGGKRIRPALLLSVSRMLQGDRESALKLAVIVEYLHAATLVHDDVIDGAELRRGRESLNAVHKNKEAVLFGDWLYMTSFWKALSLKDFRFLQTLIRVTRQMVEGELLQMEMAFQPGISAETRERITFCKTAGLFGCCCQLGAQVSGAAPEVEEAFTRFGESLGMAFQLVDDMLDYNSREVTLGKPVLKDLEEGNITLPVIYLLEEASADDRALVKGFIENGSPERIEKEKILGLIREYDCLGRTSRKAESYAAAAHEALQELPLSPGDKELLKGLPGWILKRGY